MFKVMFPYIEGHVKIPKKACLLVKVDPDLGTLYTLLSFTLFQASSQPLSQKNVLFPWRCQIFQNSFHIHVQR